MTVGNLINSVVSQISSCFIDQDREATLEDAMQMLQTMTIVAKAFVEVEVSQIQDGSKE